MSSKKKKKEKRREKRLTQKQLAANRANAQLSTGPNTAEGKEKASRNATTFNFYGQKTPVAPWEDPAEYEAFKAEFLKELAPQGPQETWLAERAIAESWRLLRVPYVEIMLYHMFEDDPDRLFYELNKLSLNESRMERLRCKALAELRTLQHERRMGERASAGANPVERRRPDSVGSPMRAAMEAAMSNTVDPLPQGGFSPNPADRSGSFREPPATPDPNPGQPPVSPPAQAMGGAS